MQPPGRHDMVFNQGMERRQRHGAGADVIGQRRQGQVDALARVALALPVQWLVLPELLEQHHRQKVRAGMAARDDVERCGWLGDRLAGPAGEAFPHRLDHLPLARDHLQRLGEVLAELHQLERTTARAVHGSRDDDALARFMLREWLAPRSLALEGRNARRSRNRFRSQLVLGGIGLKILELHLQLVEEPGLAFRARAKQLAPQLLDLQLEPRDQGIRAAVCGLRQGRGSLGLQARGPLRQDHHMGGGKVGRERFRCGCHTPIESHPPPPARAFPYPVALGRQDFCGIRQSIPSSR